MINTVLLHHSEGQLYVACSPGGEPAVWTAGYSELLSQPWLQRAGAVHVLGTAANAGLIVQLIGFKKAYPAMSAQLRIGGSNLVEDRKLSVETRMRRLLDVPYGTLGAVNPALGGWHTASDADQAVYRLVSVELSELPDDWLGGLLCDHPAWRALSFLPGVDPRAAAYMLQRIIDPRFHMSPQTPERACRLARLFGLEGASGLSAAVRWLREPCGPDQRLAASVFQTWSQGWEHWLAQDCIPPEHFLVRAAQSMRREQPGLTAGGMLQRVSIILLKFVQEVWIDVLAGRACSDGLFDPSQFFAEPDERLLWRQHCAVDAARCVSEN